MSHQLAPDERECWLAGVTEDEDSASVCYHFAVEGHDNLCVTLRYHATRTDLYKRRHRYYLVLPRNLD